MSQDIIGLSLPRKEAWAKVSGEAHYVGDLKIDGCLEGKVLRSPFAHARIRNIDVSKAKSLPGVFAVIAGLDIPDRLFGISVCDQPVLAKEHVRFAGERVAAVAAINAEIAMEALSLIQVDYEELPFVTDPLEALKPGAPVIHSFVKPGDLPTGPVSLNVLKHQTYGVGDLDQGFAQADSIYEHTFRTQVVHQGFIEPHGSMVQINSDGSVRVWSNNKAPFELRAQLAELWQLPYEEIEIIYGNIGGEFGGKGSIMDEPVCYYLALASRRPVRIMMSPAEELIASYPRHEAIITVKSGVHSDGILAARQVTVVFNAGAYASANVSANPFGLRRSLGAYRIPHTRIDGYAVYTNSIPAGHCRAPGDPQVFFAVESHTDMVAETIGMDPVAFRKINALGNGDTSPSGLQWEGINALEVLKMAVEHSGWTQAKPTAHSGIGMALTERVTGVGGAAAMVMIHGDGSATVVSGLTDPGTGSQTIMRQIAANELQIPLEKVRFGGGTTVLAPYDNGSGSSRVTNVTGHAVRLAAQDAVARLKEVTAKQTGTAGNDLTYANGFISTPGGQKFSLAEILAKAGKEKNIVIGKGSYSAETSSSTCFTVQIAEVDVEPETGLVNVRKVVSVHDIGKALNPLAVIGQVEGSVIQGMGFALNEEMAYANGQPTVTRLADYKMATALDIPQIETYLLEGEPGPGPYGAKSIGEQAISPVAPAIANAVYDAVGVRITELPITPDKLRQALQNKQLKGATQNEI